MDVKFLSPFVEAAKAVLQAETDLDVQRGKLSLQQTSLTTHQISVLISLIGEVEGVVLYSLSVPTALGLVSRMIGQAFEEFDELAQSGIAELGNVITGRATMLLSQAGINADISPPTVIIGEGVQVSTVDFTRIIVPLQTDLGEITAHLSLQEKQSAGGGQFVPAQLDEQSLQQASTVN
jgi:chemotaxis protein CheX